jgi:SAM-dependent methyltransferase
LNDLTAAPPLSWTEANTPHTARWRSESASAPSAPLQLADDSLSADVALRRLRAGEALLYVGDFRNARQLLASLERRLETPSKNTRRAAPPNLREAFHRGRARKANAHALLSHLLVSLDADYRLRLRHAPDVVSACTHAWGPPEGSLAVLPLTELLGLISAEEWRRVGLQVKGLKARLHPHHGVFTPTRGDYPQLVMKAPSPWGKRVFDVGTGTGVLGLLMIERGAKSVLATDIEPRAVACANENAQAMGYADRFQAIEADLFPEGEADVVVCNPPWIPATPRTALDRAVYDPDQRLLRRFLSGLDAHLAPGGEGWLILSDLPERLGLRAPDALAEEIARAGLTVAGTLEVAPTHPASKDPLDPLQVARAGEITRLFLLKGSR